MRSRLDEAPGWEVLHASYEARLRRSEIGVRRRIGHHLGRYAAERAWREDHRRKPDGA